MSAPEPVELTEAEEVEALAVLLRNSGCGSTSWDNLVGAARAVLAARAAAPVETCGAQHPTNPSVIPCMISDRPHAEHWSWTGCAGSHVTRAAASVEAGLADVLIVPMGDGQDAIQVVHEPCGAQLLATMTVHLDTLVGIADRHTCPAPAPAADGGAES